MPINNFYFVGHPQGGRTVLEIDGKQIVCDKISKNEKVDKKYNHCPYIWGGQFLATYCKKVALNKMEIGDCFFYVIPYPSVQNIEKLFCDLVFFVGDVTPWSCVDQVPDKYDENTLAYTEHLNRHFTHPSPRGARRTLEASIDKSFAPFDSKWNMVDILPILNTLDCVGIEKVVEKLKLELRHTQLIDAVNKNSIKQKRIEMSHGIGDKLYEKLKKGNNLNSTELNCLRIGNEINWDSLIKQSKTLVQVIK